MLPRQKFLFFLILLLTFSLRLYGIDWDSGFHLHPDERMIIMVAERIKLGNLNPRFFAYGSFPIYLLKATGTLFKLDNYNGLLYVGRFLSVLFDMVTVILVYKIGSLIISKEKSVLPLLASFFYAISVLPIQASHFYAVDILLTFLSTLTIYRLIIFLKKPTALNSVFVGVAFGLALATKITIIVLVVPILVTLSLLYFKIKSIKKAVAFLFLIFTFSFLLFTLTEPYALLDFPEFKTQIISQLRMNSNPYTFPFTLQYVETTPYWYYLKNILLWGLGIPYGVFSLISVLVITFKALTFKGTRSLFFILLIFFWIYFVIVGRSAVKFMRYMLPLYPLFAIFTAFTIYLSYKKLQKKLSPKYLLATCYLLLATFIVWPFSFIQIYSRPNTRILATSWIHQNIEEGATVAVEHWDDALPLTSQQRYILNEFPLYNWDTPSKWQELSSKISQTDYIILASNRLYIPLQRLTDCREHGTFCFPLTASYYQKLFSNKLGFKLLSQFTSYPRLPFFNIEIVDDSADESFTVYDHPKIYIFKNEKHYDSDKIFQLVTSH